MKKRLLFILSLLWFQTLFSQGAEQPRYLAVLVQFKDVSFSLDNPAVQVQDMLCKQGFNYDCATGSLLDYYINNSYGKFSPSIDVFGPVTLEGRMKDYGKDVFEQGERIGDTAPERALLEACRLLDEAVDFSQYDADGDGFVDLVMMIYAGYDQAAGAKSDALWSQQWNIQSFEDEEITSVRFDNVGLGQYISASELGGTSGTRLSGIGPLCHELGHFLGLPDFYDTDGAVHGNAGGVYAFSLMGKGLYNNNGHTPPSLNALELSLLGWLDGECFRELPQGEVVLQSGDVYVSPTQTEGEFFLYEYRSGSGWDAPLPQGLVIYHVDRSHRLVGDCSALHLWEDWRSDNAVNARADHPCFYLVPSSRPELLAYDAALAAERMVYPGLDKVLYYEPIDWEGNYTGVQITNIRQEEGGVRFRVLKGMGANINGRILDSSGAALQGVTVTLNEAEGVVATTGADGFFCLELPKGMGTSIFSVTASKKGYTPVTEEVSMGGSRRMVCLALTLPGEEDAREYSLSKYDKTAQMGFFAQVPVLGGVRFGAQDLFPYVGQELKAVSFYPYLQPSFEGEVYVIIDVDGERVLCRKVEHLNKGPYFKQELDIADAHILIEEGKELYIGYGSPSSDNNFRLGTVYPAAKGNSYYSDFSLERSSWKEMFVKNVGIYMDLALSATSAEKAGATSLTDLGYAYIEPVQGRLKEGERFPLQLHLPAGATLVEWTLDGSPINGESILLKAGTQTLHARVKYTGGREEVLELLLKVN